jgi:hypothetical protein
MRRERVRNKGGNSEKEKVGTWDMASLDRPGLASFHAFIFALTNTWYADGSRFGFSSLSVHG